MKKKINVFDYSETIMKALQKGILITTKAEKVNSMTVSWGAFGVDWGKPMFTAYIRESRFTKEQLEKNPEFTVNIPLGEADKNVISYCGSKSGRDVDKLKELGLTEEEPETISVPGIKELPLTLECRVVCRQNQDYTALSESMAEQWYPKNADGKRDGHILFYGEIVDAYIIE